MEEKNKPTHRCRGRERRRRWAAQTCKIYNFINKK